MGKVIDNIVFWGEDSFSNVTLNSLIAAGFNVQLVVTPYYNNVRYKRLEITCNKHKIPLQRTSDVNGQEVIDRLRQLKPDLCVICHFERLIKKPLLSIPKYGFINVHPSLLPNYRGMAPQHWPIINGERETGITVHYVDEGTDTGDIILQRHIPLIDDMYVSDLQKIWLKEYQTLVPEAIHKIEVGEPVKVQKNLVGSYYGKLKPEQCIIDKNGTVKQAYNLVRGVSLPYQGATCDVLTIYKAHIQVTGEETSQPVIAFRDGILVIDQYK